LDRRGWATTANRYAEILGLRFAYARNGAETIELDYFTGKEAKSSSYPKPENLWHRFRKDKSLIDDTQVQQLLTPINFTLRQGERYAF
jgi:type I restriction enzyme, R subunit